MKMNSLSSHIRITVLYVLAIFIAVTCYTFTEPTYADTYIDESGTYTYTINGFECEITKYTGTKHIVVIPSVINSYSVTKIAKRAFQSCISLEEIYIPDSVLTIDDYAFYSCTSLKNVNMPDSVTVIGNYVFGLCTSLQGINLSSSISTLPVGCFYECSSIEKIDISNSIINIDNKAFQACTSLRSIDVPKSVTSIGYNAFHSCTSLKEVAIPDTITAIPDGCFYNCSSLEKINITENVTSIGNNSFQSCTSLRSINLPESVTSIGNNAFYSCTSLKEVAIPDTITTVPDGCFYKCSSLEKIIIPENVTAIGISSFQSCTSLQMVILPNDIIKIPAYCFYECSALHSIAIPDSVTTIGEYAFYGCYLLETMNIPEGVLSIDKSAFNSCTGLTELRIPYTVTSIGINAFFNCNSLQTVYLERSANYYNGLNFSTNTTVYDNYIFHTHIYDETVTKKVTCIQDGEINYSCKYCDDTYTETIPASPDYHDYGSGLIARKPTCKENGERIYECKYCHDTYKEIIAVTEHDFDDGVIISKPTCVAHGILQYTCRICGDLYSSDIPVDSQNHNYELTSTTPATCTTDGVKCYTCSYCGDKYTENVYSTGHRYVAGVAYETNITSIPNGIKVIQQQLYSCMICGHIERCDTNNGYTVELGKSSYAYTGKAIRPTVTIKTLNGDFIPSYDYYVSYSNNKNIGKKAKATISFSSYAEAYYGLSGGCTVNFTITKRKLVKSKMPYSPTYIYNGKTRKLTLWYYTDSNYENEVQLKQGRDFKISGNKKVKKIGIYKLKIIGKGNYKGSVKIRVFVKPKDIRSLKVKKRNRTSVTLRWKKPKKCPISGYVIYYSKGDKYIRKYTKKTTYKVPCDEDYYIFASVHAYKKANGKKVEGYGTVYNGALKPVGRPKFSVTKSWDQFSLKPKRKGDYQIAVSQTKKFKKGTVQYRNWEYYGNNKYTFNTNSSWYGKTRWVKIRQYTELNGKIRMGKWSKVKKITVY